MPEPEEKPDREVPDEELEDMENPDRGELPPLLKSDEALELLIAARCASAARLAASSRRARSCRSRRSADSAASSALFASRVALPAKREVSAYCPRLRASRAASKFR